MKNKEWLKVWKSFRGGRSNTHYVYLPDHIEYDPKDHKDSLKFVAEDWAENTGGGHNYGYTVYWEEVEKPPYEYMKSIIKRLKSEVRIHENAINVLKNEEIPFMINLKEKYYSKEIFIDSIKEAIEDQIKSYRR